LNAPSVLVFDARVAPETLHVPCHTSLLHASTARHGEHVHGVGSFLLSQLTNYCIACFLYRGGRVPHGACGSWRRAGMAGVSTQDETTRTQSRTLSRLSAEPHIQAPESGSLVSLVNLVAILSSCHVVVRRGARSCLPASVAPSDWPDAETRCRCQRTTANPRLTDCDFQNRLVLLSLSTRAPASAAHRLVSTSNCVLGG
jgi:hypothetical protein